MPFDGEQLLLEIHGKVSGMDSTLNRLVKKLEGNGQPGLFDEFKNLQSAHSECAKKRAELQAEAERREDIKWRKLAIICGVVATLVSAGINWIIGSVPR